MSNVKPKELSTVFHCKLCLKQLSERRDLNCIDGKANLKFNVAHEIAQLSFQIPSTSNFVCCECKRLIKKRQECRKTVEWIDDKLFRLSHGVDFPEGQEGDEGDVSGIEDDVNDDSSFTPVIKNVTSLATSGPARLIRKQTLFANKVNTSENESEPATVIRKQTLLVNKINNNSKVRITENESVHNNEHDYCHAVHEKPKTAAKAGVKEIVIGVPSATMITPLSKAQIQPLIASRGGKNIVATKVNKSYSFPAKAPVHTCNVSTQTRETLRDLPPPIVSSLHANSTTACIYVKWPSSSKQKVLPKDLTSIGIAILKGNSNDIAKKVWGHDLIKIQLQQLYMKDLIKEVDAICSEKTVSMLRKSSPEDILAFTFEKLDSELQEYCPTFRNILKTVATRKNYEEEAPWLSTMCMAASLLLKNRQPKMYALQKMLDMLEDGEKETMPRCLLKHRYIFIPSLS